MIEKMRVARIKYRGEMDFPVLYKLVWDWMEDHGFTPVTHTYRYRPPTEFDVYIHGEDLKVNGYVKYDCHVKFMSNHYKEIEVKKDGETKKMFSGNIIIEVYGIAETDYERGLDGKRLWEATPMKVKLKNFFENFIYKWRFGFNYADEIGGMAAGLANDIRTALGLEQRTFSHERLRK